MNHATLFTSIPRILQFKEDLSPLFLHGFERMSGYGGNRRGVQQPRL